MNKQLFINVFRNKVVRKDIFSHVNHLNKINSIDGESFKWVDAKNRISLIIKYNYIKEYKEYFNSYSEKRIGIDYSFVYYETIRLCLRYGRQEMLEILSNDFLVVFSNQMKFSIAIKEAAYSGRLEIVEFVMNRYFKYNNNNLKESYDINNYLQAFIISPTNSTDLTLMNWFYNSEITEIRDYSQFNQSDICKLYELAAIKEKKYIVEWLLEKNFRLKSNNEYQKVFQKALENGKIEFLDWFRQLDHTTTIDLDSIVIDIDQLVYNSQLDSLKWAKQHFKNFKHSPEVMDSAIKSDDLEMIKWLHYNQTDGYNLSKPTRYSGSKCTFCSISTLEWLLINHIELLSSLEMNSSIYSSMDKFKWFLEHFPELCTPEAIDYACVHGNLEIIKILHANQLNRTEGCTTNAMDYAARNNHIEVIKWLHENRTEGCTSAAIDNACHNSNMELIHWLAENTTSGCTERALATAITKNNRELFCYLMETVLPPTQQNSLVLSAIEEAKLKFQSTNNNNNNDISQSQEDMFEYFITVVGNPKYKEILSHFGSRTLFMACEIGCLPYVKGIEQFYKEEIDEDNDYKLLISVLYNHKFLAEYYLKKEKIDVSKSFFIALEYSYIEIADILIDHFISIGSKVVMQRDDSTNESLFYQKKKQYIENQDYLFNKIFN